MKKPIGLFQIVEVQINTGAGSQVKIGDQPQLRTQEDQKIYVQGIQVFTEDVLPNSPSGATNASFTELQKCSLVLSIKNEERIFQYPLAALIGVNDQTNPYVFQLPEFDSLEVDWAKSFIQYGAAPVPTYVICLGITYTRVLAQ